MDKLSFKTFTFPINPHTYKEEYIREPKYRTQDGQTLYDDMGEMRKIITGKGVFYGDNAFAEFKKLAALFEEKAAGNVQHPIWGTTLCYFTGLEMTQEPRDNYVSYAFTFTRCLADGSVPK